MQKTRIAFCSIHWSSQKQLCIILLCHLRIFFLDCNFPYNTPPREVLCKGWSEVDSQCCFAWSLGTEIPILSIPVGESQQWFVFPCLKLPFIDSYSDRANCNEPLSSCLHSSVTDRGLPRASPSLGWQEWLSKPFVEPPCYPKQLP